MEYNYYNVLKVSQNASKETIQNAYRTLVKKYHPDLQSPNSDKKYYEDKMKLINLAYSILSNDMKRAEYDAILEQYSSSNDIEFGQNPNYDFDEGNKYEYDYSKQTTSANIHEWMEKVIEANNSDNAFEVTVNIDTLVIPQLCTCCLSKPEPSCKKEVSATWTEQHFLKRIEKTVKILFPVCSNCLKHQEELSNIRVKVILISLIPSILITLILISMNLITDWVQLTIAGTIVTLCSVFLFGRNISLSPIGEHHSSRGDTVEILYCDGSVIKFLFYNCIYAELFADVNECEAIPVKQKKYSYGLTILKGRLAVQVFSWAIALTIVIHLGMSYIINPDDIFVNNNTEKHSNYELSTTMDNSENELEFNQSEQPLPSNGIFRKYSSNNCIAPLKIITASDKLNYFIKVVDWDSEAPILTAFIHGGEAIDVKLPLGKYEIKYAVGESWYGEKYLFGPHTSYSKAEEQFSFYISDNYVHGYTVELYNKINGNLETTTIDKSEF